jgi:hypothetical protein
MAQLLGYLLGWTANIFAALIAMIAALAFVQDSVPPSVGWLSLGASLGVFLIGRALRRLFGGSVRLA